MNWIRTQLERIASATGRRGALLPRSDQDLIICLAAVGLLAVRDHPTQYGDDVFGGSPSSRIGISDAVSCAWRGGSEDRSASAEIHDRLATVAGVEQNHGRHAESGALDRPQARKGRNAIYRAGPHGLECPLQEG
jgi:hypothetical protein